MWPHRRTTPWMVPKPADAEHDDAASETAVTTVEVVDAGPASHRIGHQLRAAVARFPFAKWSQLLALLPPLLMFRMVRKSSDLQWFDYWTILPRIVNPDGSLAIRGLLTFTEGHILAGPQRHLFWLNVRFFDGVNRTLGYYVIAVVLAQVLVLRAALPRALDIGQWWYSGLVIGISILLFAPQGVWNFTRAMSGTAWLTANLFSVAAIVLAARPTSVLGHATGCSR